MHYQSYELLGVKALLFSSFIQDSVYFLLSGERGKVFTSRPVFIQNYKRCAK